MTKLIKKLWRKSRESWEEFLFQRHDEAAQEALEEIMAKEDYWQRLEDSPDFEEEPWETNSTADKRERWRKNAADNGDCSYCPPHGGENFRRGRRGPKKPKKKDHR